MPNWTHQQTVGSTSNVCAVRSGHPDIQGSLALDHAERAKQRLRTIVKQETAEMELPQKKNGR